MTKDMNMAMQRWTNKDDKRLNEILGFDKNGMPIELKQSSHTQMRVIGMDVLFPDDLSTIAGDTLGDGIPFDDENPRTPEKRGKKKSGGDDDDTEPETPIKYFVDSLASKSFAQTSDHAIMTRCRLLVISFFLGSILLGAIAVMSLTFYNMRNDGNGDISLTFKKAPSDEDFREDASTPSPWTPSVNRPSLGSIRDTIISMAPDFYAASDAVALLDDSTSIQYEVLDWMAQDPLIALYSPERIVQRFALGSVYWSLTASKDSLPSGGWMSYKDECQWPTTNSSLCSASDKVTTLYLERMRLNGTLAPEIGLLTNLKLISLTSNNIHGYLPTQLGLLTRLEQLSLLRNEVEGTIPTEIGLLKNLGYLSLGNNNLAGTFPSEIGNIDRLESLRLQRNTLNGTLPDVISLLSHLTVLQLELNNFQGPVPDGLGNLYVLEALTLQGNDFTGEIPNVVCTSQSFKVASVDCEKVTCACCEGCKIDEEDMPNDNEPPPVMTQPTGAPTVSPTSLDPAIFPTTSDPNMLSNKATLAPTTCQSIQAVRECYDVESFIDFKTFNCDPSDNDVVALYHVSDLRQSGLKNELFWMPSCLEIECSFILSDGFLFEEFSVVGNAPWPFPPDDYILFILRIPEPGSLQVIAESIPFRVEEECATLDTNPTTDPTMDATNP